MMRSREEDHGQTGLVVVSDFRRTRDPLPGRKDDLEAAAQQEIALLCHHGRPGFVSLGRPAQGKPYEREVGLYFAGDAGW